MNTIRTLAMDAVQRANSGHPGTPMALAPVAYCLWQRFLRFDPRHPIWPNRDRFVLSVGHASMLLYAMLHLTGVRAVNPKYETLGELSVTLEDIKRFRQLREHAMGAVLTRVSVEQGATLGWARYVRRLGRSIGMETFGASAPLKELQKKFGFVPEAIIGAARAQV